MTAPTQAEVEAFVAKQSDFAFEMHVRSLLLNAGIPFEHAGTYEDSVTGKSRQFDFRVRYPGGEWVGFFCIECKNVKEGAPYVIHRTLRDDHEAFHETIATKGGGKGTIYGGEVCGRAVGALSAFAAGDFVGRSLDQFTTHPNKQSEENLFEKVSQALSVAGALLKHDLAPDFREGRRAITVQPIVVVPDSGLWVADYGNDAALGAIRQVKETDFFVGRVWEVGHVTSGQLLRYEISHVILVGASRLVPKLAELAQPGARAPYMPPKMAIEFDDAHRLLKNNRTLV